MNQQPEHNSTADGRPMHRADGDRWGNWCTCSRVRCVRCHRDTCVGATVDSLCLECWDRETGWTEKERR